MDTKTRNKKIEGTLKSFNFSPKGGYEGLLIETAKGVVQVNFPQELGPRMMESLKAGDPVALSAGEQEDDRPREHPVYNLVRLEGERHLAAQDASGPRLEGTVARFNYARHGEPNGAVLDTGDFIHLKPNGAKAAALHIGQKLVAEGEMRPTITGHRAMEAAVVNGVEIRHSKPAKKAAGKKHK